ncbi:AAA family ATPase, partial [Bacillus thuringiensis]|nr:AAA family ATPase [Bacillus thuringiensis]
MLLKEIIIKNYRKFKNESFSMADDITLLAGANNSGKTSMINLMGSIMQSGKTPFCISDIPVKLSKKWVDEVYEIFVRCFDEDVLSTVEMIVHELFGDELSSLKGDLIIPATLIRFKIEYTETDDIRKFADFIMDLDPDNKNFYFEYLFQPTRKSFREALEDNYNKLYARYKKIKSLEGSSSKVQQFKEIILSIYEASIIEKCYFSDRNYIDKVEIDVSIFRRLFNYKYINAGRPLDDQSNGNFKSLSKNMIELATHNSNLNTLLEE